MTISVVAEMLFNKTQHPLTINTLTELRIKGNALSLINAPTKDPQLTSHLMVKDRTTSP